jgi:hypothetical protein
MTSKSILKNKIKKILSSKPIWPFYGKLAEISAEVYQQKIQLRKEQDEIKFVENFPFIKEKMVLNGPFRGLKYPDYRSLHSTFIPKILGSYEFELHSTLDRLKSTPYHSILDIGCAEGYYAVGFTKMFPKSILTAYDINPKARESCELLAKFNNIPISDNFRIKGKCGVEDLEKLENSGRHLIFSDCEGFEVELFTEKSILFLLNSDIIVECHDFITPGISDKLQNLFSKTHRVDVVCSIPDIFRYRTLDFPQLKGFSLEKKIRLLQEKRPTQMEWLICTSLTLGS